MCRIPFLIVIQVIIVFPLHNCYKINLYLKIIVVNFLTSESQFETFGEVQGVEIIVLLTFVKGNDYLVWFYHEGAFVWVESALSFRGSKGKVFSLVVLDFNVKGLREETNEGIFFGDLIYFREIELYTDFPVRKFIESVGLDGLINDFFLNWLDGNRFWE